MRKAFPYCLALAIILGLGIHYGWGYTSQECINCHAKGSEDSTLQISLDDFSSSVHGRDMACRDCHQGIIGREHETQRGSGTVDCGQCHDEENRHGIRSKSGIRPSCFSCHTRHAILQKDNKTASIHKDNLKQTCGACHPAQTGRATFLSWITSAQVRSHGKQDFGYKYDKADCLGCHQGRAAHGETVCLNNRHCYRCHAPLDGSTPLWGTIHPSTGSGRPAWSGIARSAYAVAIILLSVGGLRFYILRFSRSRRKK